MSVRPAFHLPCENKEGPRAWPGQSKGGLGCEGGGERAEAEPGGVLQAVLRVWALNPGEMESCPGSEQLRDTTRRLTDPRDCGVGRGPIRRDEEEARPGR